MKRIISLLLAFVMAFSAVTTVSAAESPITYEGSSGYSAEKLSHPETGSGEVDGLIEYEGENDRGQNYAWSSVGYGDYVYVGTCFGAIYQTLRIMAMQSGIDYSVMKQGIDVLFNGTLYNGDDGDTVTTNRSVLVKINTKTSETTIVAGPTTAGGYRAAVEFQDKLYFAATGATPYLLEVDPATDETQVVCYSERPTSASISTGIRGLAVYQDMLVATMIGNNGAYMVASKNPSEGPDSFEVIGTQEDFLDYPAYHYTDSIFGGSIWDIIEYNNKLYITVVTGKNGDKQAFALFSGELDENGEWHYDLIAGDEADGAKYPYGLGSDRSGAANLIVYGGYLYIGGYNDPMVALPEVLEMNFENLYKDLSSPVCLWRMDENEDIEMVAGDANEVFPEGPVGNMDAGFGNNLNQYVWRMAAYDGQLYVGTFDIGSLAYPLMQFTNGDILHMTREEWESQINYIRIFIDTLTPDESDQTESDITDETTGETEETAAIAVTSLSAQDFSDTATETTDENSDLTDKSSGEIADDLSEMTSLMEDMSNLYDYSDSDTTVYRLRNNREVFYNLLASLVEKYEEVKDELPAELVENLDPVLNAEVVTNFKYFVETCAYLSQGERGFDLLVSSDGENFDVITRDGFGDPYNHGCRVFAITDTGLCVGTANPFFGAQVWQLTNNNRSAIENSELAASEGTYDNNPESEQHTAQVAIDFKDNTIEKIECNYNILEEGADYTITEEGVTFTDSFLSSLDVADYNLTFFFNVGSRGRYVLHVIDTTETGGNSGNTGDNGNTGSNENAGNTDNNGSSAKPNTGSSSSGSSSQKTSNVKTGDNAQTALYAGILIAMALICSAVFVIRRKRQHK